MSHDDLTPYDGTPLSRRRFLTLAGGAAGALALVRPAEALAQLPLATRERGAARANFVKLIAARTTIDLAGKPVKTWAYNDAVPGPVLRVRAGETVRARVTNRLYDTTTVHWHGIALANPMDGVPDVTQRAIARGKSFDYEFVAPDPGTYFFHPHVGLQLDHGLYAPLIVDDPAEPGGYDKEWIIVLDDWTDGVGPSPATILARLRKGKGMGMGSGMDMGSSKRSGMDMGGQGKSKARGSAMDSMMSDALGGMAGDVAYPLYLLNGRPPKDPQTFRAKRGQRIRLRLINAGSDTAFRFAIGGHRLTVTHADGFPVEPVETDAVLLGMGERIDAIVTCQGDANPVVARAEGKGKAAHAVLRAGTGAIRRWKVPELNRQLVTVSDLVPGASATLAPRAANRVHRLVLGGNDMSYRWTINGKAYNGDLDYAIAQGDRVRIVFRNTSTMWHPMHLHGHTFAVMTNETPGVRKDTVVVKPGDTVAVEFDADNPGSWMVHCHNTYHLEAGMMTTLRYT
jgi:FtsP/CotA-like multicopper oxidase with cupredoxin domain